MKISDTRAHSLEFWLKNILVITNSNLIELTF